jgi:hypothetical protein
MAQPGGGGATTINLTVAPVINGLTVDNADRVRQAAAMIAAEVKQAVAADFSRAVDGLILGGGAL